MDGEGDGEGDGGGEEGDEDEEDDEDDEEDEKDKRPVAATSFTPNTSFPRFFFLFISNK